MNARQKAKYWKKKYQELASVPVPIKNVVSERRITTISYTKVINDEIYKLGLGRLAIAEPFHDYHDVLPMYEGEWRNEYDKRRSSKSP